MARAWVSNMWVKWYMSWFLIILHILYKKDLTAISRKISQSVSKRETHCWITVWVFFFFFNGIMYHLGGKKEKWARPSQKQCWLLFLQAVLLQSVFKTLSTRYLTSTACWKTSARFLCNLTWHSLFNRLCSHMLKRRSWGDDGEQRFWIHP